MTDGVKRTVVAQQAIDLGELLNFRFEQKFVGKDVPKRLSVITLESQSTGGGKMARQSVVLTPLEEGVQGSIMCGWIDVARREAELREHRLVADQFEARYHVPFDVGFDEYEALLSELQSVLANQGFTLARARVVSLAPPGPAAASPERGNPLGTVLWILFGCIFGLGIAYLLR
jgi:hypothetical protein